MLIARILGILLPIALGASLILFLLTKDRKWLRIFGQILTVGIVIMLIFIGIYFIERFLLVV
jgi:hypothetical protein